MSARRTIFRAVFAGAVFALLLSSTLLAKVLPVQVVTQEKDQWCWAGSSKCIINYYGTAVNQCQIAEFTRTHNNWRNFGPVNCCTDPNQGCNYWNYLVGGGGSIQDILSNWGISSSIWYREMWLSEVTNFINDNRPFIIRWGWTSGGGHFVVGHGLEGNNLYYMDPWYGEGAKIGTYGWVVSGADHTWTHGAGMNTPYVVVNRTLTLQCGTGGTTNPAPGSYVHQSGTNVTITAVPGIWNIFNGWTGSLTSSSNPVTFLISTDMTVIANYRTIEAPSNFSGRKVLNRSLSQAEYINVLSWEANTKNTGLSVAGYRIYLVGSASRDLIEETGADTFAFQHRGVARAEEYLYDIVAVLTDGREGKASSVIVD